jgi:hypothetical protein
MQDERRIGLTASLYKEPIVIIQMGDQDEAVVEMGRDRVDVRAAHRAVDLGQLTRFRP